MGIDKIKVLTLCMQTFIDRIISTITNDHEAKYLHKLKLIVPSERAKWVLKNAIIQEVSKSRILPEIVTIHNYILSLSPLNLINDIEAQFILLNKAENSKLNFDNNKFSTQAPSLIKDFNVLESYMIDHKKLFYNLRSIENIENWSFRKEELSIKQEEFIQNYSEIGDVLSLLKNELLTHRTGTSGMLYRDVANNYEEYLHEEENVYLIGLNALSKAEVIIVEHLSNKCNAKIIVDVDEFYINNKDHEAGYFYRKHWNSSYNSPIKFLEKYDKKINIYNANTIEQQINYVNEILNNTNSKEKTNIITMDESLGPVIYEQITNHFEDVNFSSGLSINYVESIQLLKFLLESSNNQEITKNKISLEWYKKLISFSTIKQQLKNTEEVLNMFHKHQSFNLDLVQINIENNHLAKLIGLTSSWSKFEEGNSLKILKEFIHLIYKIYVEKEIEKKSINHALDQINYVEKLSSKHDVGLNKKQLLKIFFNQINQIKIPIKGTRHSKIQIIGLLESRIIDADNLIVVSCNEDFLPKKDNKYSLLPNDLKKHYRLPTKYEKDALFAYYFYRSLHYPKNIHLISVNGDNKGINFSEPSRYLRQINKELINEPGISVSIKENFYPSKTKVNQIAINENIKEQIENWMTKGISPSSINCLNNCSMDFYYNYVLKIKETTSPKKYLEASEWGIGVHQTLEMLYHQKDTINELVIKQMLKELDQIMDKNFRDLFKDKRHLKGKNAIVYYSYNKCIANMLKKEIFSINKYGSYKIIALEKDISVNTEILINGKKKNVTLIGIIDRVDETASGIRLVDYKTGLVKPQDINISKIEQLSKKPKALQLLFYSLLYEKKYNIQDPLFTQIISLKNTQQPHQNLHFNNNKELNAEDIKLFEEWLLSLLYKINSDEMIFHHKTDSLYCENC